MTGERFNIDEAGQVQAISDYNYSNDPLIYTYKNHGAIFSLYGCIASPSTMHLCTFLPPPPFDFLMTSYYIKVNCREDGRKALKDVIASHSPNLYDAKRNHTTSNNEEEEEEEEEEMEEEMEVEGEDE